jgi:hypothetical protein
MELLFYEQFILLKSMRKRIKTPFLSVSCIGVEDGEKVELYTNGKSSSVFTVQDGGFVIPVHPNTNYRIASPAFPYGVKFTTTEDTDGMLVFQSFQAESAEFKNLYRIIERLCSKVKEQEQEIKNLSGYRTE